MVAKSAIERLKRRADFVALSRARNSSGQPGLVLQAAPRIGRPQQTDGVRVGFTASKKVGNAIARNRAKRRLRELTRLVLEPNSAPGYDYVLIARGTTPTRSFDGLKKDLQRAMKRLGVWHPTGNPDMARRQSEVPSI